MKIIRTTKAKKERKKNLFMKLWNKITFKKEEPFKRKIYVKEQLLKKYVYTHSHSLKKHTTVGRNLSEAKSNAEHLLREEYPKKLVKIKDIYEIRDK